MNYVPENISTYGAQIDGVISFIGWIVFVWLVVVELVFIYFLIRYRRREGVRASWLPAKTLKVCYWVLIPSVLVLVCDMVIEAKSMGPWHLITEDVPENPDVLVRVTARQFAWTFTYAGKDGKLDTPDDFKTESEMHVPKGKVVRIQLESVDVLHSFWVPNLRLKQDVVPGRSIPGWFETTKEGKYEIACAEICGPSHTSMRAMLTVESPQAFGAWSATLAEQQRAVAKEVVEQ